MKFFIVLLAGALISCEKSSDSDLHVGINKDGTWTAESTSFVTCYTDSNLSAVDSFSGLGAGQKWTQVVNGNKATETLEDNDCKITTNYDVVFDTNSVSISNSQVTAQPSPCQVTFNLSGLTDVTSINFNYSTGQQVADVKYDSVSSPWYFIMRASGLEAGSKYCLMRFERR